MKKHLSKVVALSVAAMMVVGMSGFTGVKSVNAKSKELIKLDVFSLRANNSGPQLGWFGKVIKDKFNIQLNIISANLAGVDTKFATQMASGNLGDIVVYGAEDQKYQDSIKAGMLLDLSKNNLLTKYAPYITKNYSKAIEKNRKNFGKGKAIYGIGSSVANANPMTPSEGTVMGWGPNLRWDLYEKLGKPKIKTMEDYLPLLQKMKKLAPKSDSGKPTYAFSMWADWDGNMMMNAKQFACMYGYDELGFLLVHANQEKYQDLLQNNSYYMRALKLYFEANKAGLLDPDSISQKYDDAANKMKDGQTLFSWFPWEDSMYNSEARQAKGIGFKLVPFSEEKVYSNGFNNYGSTSIIAIGSKTKYPKEVMQLINWLYSPEGVITAFNGPKGYSWDVKNGKPYVTAVGKKALQDPKGTNVPENFGGGVYQDGTNWMNFQTVNESSIDPDYKEPYNWQLWSSTLDGAKTKLDINWNKAMKATSSKDYFVKNKMISVAPATEFTPAVPSTDLEQKRGQIASIIRQDSWKMVFAKTDAEYNSIKNDMITKANGLGYKDLVKFYVGEAKKLFAARKAVTK